MRKPLMGVALIAVLVFGIGYIIGQVRGAALSSAASATPTVPQATFPQPGDPANGGWRNMGPRADGTVMAINGDRITVKADSDVGQPGEYGKVMTIVLSGSTTYEAGHDSATTASKASIKVGSYLIATGKLSSDGLTLMAATASVRDGGPDANGGGPAFYAPGGSDSAGPNA